MKIAAAALVALVLAVLQLYRVSLPSLVSGAVVLNLALMALCFYLLVEGILAGREAGKLRAARAETSQVTEKLARLEASIGAAAARESELQRQFQQAREEAEGLRTSLRAVETKARETKLERPEIVNAEIVHFLSLLQRKGRFIDFLMDDITRYDDKQVGAAARIVHQGCAEVLREYFHIEPVRKDAEGMAVTLEPNYNSAQNRLVGKVVGNPPFRGVVLHRGWKTTKVTLPRVVTDSAVAQEIIQPAEIELT